MNPTTDFAEFGMREIKEVIRLLNAWVEEGLPEDFDQEKVTVMMNKNSGNVFLTNEEFQVCMMCDDKLEMWLNCPNCGAEDFKGNIEIDEDNQYCEHCRGEK